MVPQSYGEWFELYDNYPGTLDLDGITITNSVGQTVTVTPTLVGIGFSTTSPTSTSRSRTTC